MKHEIEDGKIEITCEYPEYIAIWDSATCELIAYYNGMEYDYLGEFTDLSDAEGAFSDYVDETQ